MGWADSGSVSARLTSISSFTCSCWSRSSPKASIIRPKRDYNGAPECLLLQNLVEQGEQSVSGQKCATRVLKRSPEMNSEPHPGWWPAGLQWQRRKMWCQRRRVPPQTHLQRGPRSHPRSPRPHELQRTCGTCNTKRKDISCFILHIQALVFYSYVLKKGDRIMEKNMKNLRGF